MKNIMVVVTDLGYLKAYELQRTSRNTPRLEMIEEITTADEKPDRFRDAFGRYRNPTVNGNWATPWGERHNIELEQKKRSIRQLAETLHRVLKPERVEGCYLAASKEINHQIMEELPPPCRAKILKNVHADLTKLETAELLERFEV
jgi:hypothetical protein